MPQKDTKLEKVTKQIEAVLAERFESQNAILREGDRIVIPTFMSYKDAAEAIISHEKKMEEQVQTLSDFDCHPHDGLVALYHAIKSTFGTLLGAESYGFFGKIPGRTYTVPISYSETLTVPVGEAEIPGLPITMSIQPMFDNEGKTDTGGMLRVIFNYRRKYEPLVKQIEELTKSELRDHSIFRGKAIDSKYNFLNVDSFDQSRVVYSKDERRQIEANILSPIANAQAWKESGSRLRRGVLLYGEYGTGKTLTALLTGKHCVTHGWTFINVLPGDDIVRALRFAKRYQPACVFFEDIDNDTGAERNDRINEILNTIDGLLSKDSELVTVLTTNHIEHLSRGMLRPGRLDSIIKMGVLDKESVIQMIEMVGRSSDGSSLIEGKLDADAIWEAAKGYMPAFVAEAVTKAKAYALSRGTDGHKIKINGTDIIDAMIELRPQFEMMCSDQKLREPEFTTVVRKLIVDQVTPVVEEMADHIIEELSQ